MIIFKHHFVTQEIIGCAMKVHRVLGNGFQEVIYQRALKIEMENAGLVFQREVSMPIYYNGKNIGTRRVDFLVEEKIVVELKATTQLEKVHFTQTINYLEVYNIEIGLLINFGNTSLQFHRLTNKKFLNSNGDM